MLVCFPSTQLTLVMADDRGARSDKSDQKTQAQSSANAKKRKTPPGSQAAKTGSTTKASDSPASYLWDIKSIAPSNNGAEIENLIGNPKPFTVKARDARTLLIYSPGLALTPADQKVLERIYADITKLSVPPSRTEEIEVPHYRALGDLAARAKRLNYPGITAEAAGDDKLRINRANWVTDEEYKHFVEDLMAMASRLSA
jgi:hypothetical protein